MADDLVKCTVAPHRTVYVPDPNAKPQRASPTKAPGLPALPDPATRARPVVTRHGPGAVVELPADEAQRLMRLGFLVDPNPRQPYR